MIEKLMKELEKLQESQRILEKIWLEIGPYQSGSNQISSQLFREMSNHFEFDDSE